MQIFHITYQLHFRTSSLQLFYIRTSPWSYHLKSEMETLTTQTRGYLLTEPDDCIQIRVMSLISNKSQSGSSGNNLFITSISYFYNGRRYIYFFSATNKISQHLTIHLSQGNHMLIGLQCRMLKVLSNTIQHTFFIRHLIKKSHFIFITNISQFMMYKNSLYIPR